MKKCYHVHEIEDTLVLVVLNTPLLGRSAELARLGQVDQRDA